MNKREIQKEIANKIVKILIDDGFICTSEMCQNCTELLIKINDL